jgi:glycerol-3-phosphate cytidylyltransferase
MGKQTIVYTCGCYDMFHIGHLNILENAKALGDQLIVAVSTDELMERHKPGKVVVPFEHRIAIIKSLRCVDIAIPQNDRDKYLAWQKIKYDILVVGDDWYGKKSFREYEEKLKNNGVKVVYFPYTKGISSTEIREIFEARVNGNSVARLEIKNIDRLSRAVV